MEMHDRWRREMETRNDPGKKLEGEHPLVLQAKIADRLVDTFLISFHWEPHL